MTEVQHGVETKIGLCQLCGRDVKVRRVPLSTGPYPGWTWLCLECIRDVSKAFRGYK